MAGKTPGDSDKLKTNVKGTLTTEANHFKIAGVILSGSGPLLTSKPRPRPWRPQLQTFFDRRQELVGHYPGSNHPARIRFEKTQQCLMGIQPLNDNLLGLRVLTTVKLSRFHELLEAF
jgi:hypothetical protein